MTGAVNEAEVNEAEVNEAQAGAAQPVEGLPERCPADPPWWHAFFDDAFAELWLDASEGQPLRAEAQADALASVLQLQAGDRVFDQCCGIGRLTAPLVTRGYHVVAVDGVRAYVERARARCVSATKNTWGRAELHVADALTFVPSIPCDGAFNWYTSFGYSEHDEVNLQMLRAAHAALREGGRFVLDYPDMERVRREFRPQSVRERDTPNGRFVATRDAHLDERRGMLVDRWTIRGPGGVEQVRWGETRLYSGADLAGLLRRAGFQDVQEVQASAAGYEASEAEGRVVWVGQR